MTINDQARKQAAADGATYVCLPAWSKHDLPLPAELAFLTTKARLVDAEVPERVLRLRERRRAP